MLRAVERMLGGFPPNHMMHSVATETAAQLRLWERVLGASDGPPTGEEPKATEAMMLRPDVADVQRIMGHVAWLVRVSQDWLMIRVSHPDIAISKRLTVGILVGDAPGWAARFRHPADLTREKPQVSTLCRSRAEPSA